MKIKRIAVSALLIPAIVTVQSVSAAETTPGAIDFSPLVANIDFSSVVAVLMSIAAGAIGIALAVAGIRHIRSMVRGV
ncbi:hypothetical protein SOV92_14680 [Pectobacterium brasiliense]|uniref:Phage-related membrane protein n=1 Tax=Pectobacterium brasiliense TaxID=180957 RepID=A0AAW9HF61_9GAMM|nr:hypothetical protein [Pectobacterium brasiliense]MDY4376402.1 hypothetical protein [Pectobacterium brasiliense]MDY4379058.1 hypothetical protein [Pectobacterium brasiliense]GLY63354.1 hypothetical protein Pcaca05_42110 [Pectobacterium carotovorum subsp. carotovorum]